MNYREAAKKRVVLKLLLQARGIGRDVTINLSLKELRALNNSF